MLTDEGGAVGASVNGTAVLVALVGAVGDAIADLLHRDERVVPAPEGAALITIPAKGDGRVAEGRFELLAGRPGEAALVAFRRRVERELVDLALAEQGALVEGPREIRRRAAHEGERCQRKDEDGAALAVHAR